MMWRTSLLRARGRKEDDIYMLSSAVHNMQPHLTSITTPSFMQKFHKQIILIILSH